MAVGAGRSCMKVNRMTMDELDPDAVRGRVTEKRSDASSPVHSQTAGPNAMRDTLLAGLAIAFGALFLLVPAIVNGAPFIFPDTPTYLAFGKLLASANPSDAIVALQNDPALLGHSVPPAQREALLDLAASYLGARSVLYSLFLNWSLVAFSMWGAAYLQCLFIAAALRSGLAVVFERPIGLIRFLLLCVCLSALTPAGVSGSLLMADAFTGPLLLLICALFIGWERMNPSGRVYFATGICMAVMVHLSNLPIAVLTGSAAAVVVMVRARKISAAAMPGLALLAALGASMLANGALGRYAEAHLGRELLRPPFLTARVIDDGPGHRFLEEKCGSSKYRICAFADRILASGWLGGNSMIWQLNRPYGGIYLLEDASVRKDLRDQDLSFVLDTFKSWPLQQVVASAKNAVRLLYSFRLDGRLSDIRFRYHDYSTAHDWIGSLALAQALPNRAVCEPIENEFCGNVDVTKLSRLHYLIVALSLALVAWLTYRIFRQGRLRLRSLRNEEIYAALLIAGIVANAVACGVLGGSFDRYQVRVIWLLPAAVLAILLFGKDRLRLPGRSS